MSTDPLIIATEGGVVLTANKRLARQLVRHSGIQARMYSDILEAIK